MNKSGFILQALVWGALIVGQQVLADDLDALKQLMGDFNVKIEHKSEMIAGKENVPPWQRDRWDFKTGVKVVSVNYTHPYRRRQSSIGFTGDSFGNWYGNDTIHILINGADIFAQKPAKQLEAREGTNGCLRLVWELEKKGELILNILIPDDGRAIYVRLDIIPSELSIETVQVKSGCYPGGFGPGHKLPSHRWIVTANGEWGVPRDFKPSPENPYPETPFGKGEEWIFYADKLQSKGSLALLVDRDEKPSGKVRMSNYGQSTELNYPADTRQIHLAFYAFETENGYALKTFMSSLERERAVLKSLPFWME